MAVKRESVFVKWKRAEVSAPEIWGCVQKLLREAAETCAFVNVTYPVWDGWANARMIAARLPPQISNARYAKAEGERDTEVFFYVETILQAAAITGRLERRRYRPFDPDGLGDDDRDNVEEWQYRLPGDLGHCYWCPDYPLGAPPGSDNYAAAHDKALTSRQVVELCEQLARTGSDIPPYVVARAERYMLHPSRGDNRICW